MLLAGVVRSLDRHVLPKGKRHGLVLSVYAASLIVLLSIYGFVVQSVWQIEDVHVDSAIMTISRFESETEALEIRWHSTVEIIKATGGENGRAIEEVPGFPALRLAIDVLVNRMSIFGGGFHEYLPPSPKVEERFRDLQAEISDLDRRLRPGQIVSEPWLAATDREIDALGHDVSIYVALVHRLRSKVVQESLDQINGAKTLLGISIIISIAAILLLLRLVLRQNAQLEEAADNLQERARQAEDAQERTEALMASRMALFANTSHELRTPLNAILGYSELMRMQTFGPLGQQRYVEYCEDIHQSGELLLSVVDDILALGEAEIGSKPLTCVPLRLTALVDRVHGLLAGKARQKDIRFLRSGFCDKWVLGDERAVCQVLINIMENAIKYSPAGSTVLMETRLADGWVSISIDDEGPGIAPDELQRIIEPFERGSNAYIRTTKGAGLGLAIVNSLVRRMAGTLALDGGNRGGLQVTVGLPAAEAQVRETEIFPPVQADYENPGEKLGMRLN